jgi:hypothetical protein
MTRCAKPLVLRATAATTPSAAVLTGVLSWERLETTESKTPQDTTTCSRVRVGETVTAMPAVVVVRSSPDRY